MLRLCFDLVELSQYFRSIQFNPTAIDFKWQSGEVDWFNDSNKDLYQELKYKREIETNEDVA